jgi:hypothetical protein
LEKPARLSGEGLNGLFGLSSDPVLSLPFSKGLENSLPLPASPLLLKAGFSEDESLLPSNPGGFPEDGPEKRRFLGLSELSFGVKDLDAGERFLPGEEADESFKELKIRATNVAILGQKAQKAFKGSPNHI